MSTQSHNQTFRQIIQGLSPTLTVEELQLLSRNYDESEGNIIIPNYLLIGASCFDSQTQEYIYYNNISNTSLDFTQIFPGGSERIRVKFSKRWASNYHNLTTLILPNNTKLYQGSHVTTWFPSLTTCVINFLDNVAEKEENASTSDNFFYLDNETASVNFYYKNSNTAPIYYRRSGSTVAAVNLFGTYSSYNSATLSLNFRYSGQVATTVLPDNFVSQYVDYISTTFSTDSFLQTIGKKAIPRNITTLDIGENVSTIRGQLKAGNTNTLTTIWCERPAGLSITLPTAGDGTGMCYNKNSYNVTIYTDNETFKNYDWATDNVTPTFYHLDGTPWA